MNLSLDAICVLTEWSKRTVWRRISDNSLTQCKVNGRVMIPLSAIAPYLCLHLTDEEQAILAHADGSGPGIGQQGDAESQNEMALIFLDHGKQKGAAYWLGRAAEQDHADAMNLLGMCYLRGEGVPRDDAKGMMWLTKSAGLGHRISREQVSFIRHSGLV